MTVHGKHRKRRPGVHKTARSPEVVAWEREHSTPAAPPWMDATTHAALAGLRRQLEAERLA